MTKPKISKKPDSFFENLPKQTLKTNKGLSPHNARERMKNKVYISSALWECLVENDVDGFKEILRTHLELTNKDDFAKKSGIPKRTLFRMLTPEGNPTLDNVSKIIHQLCA